LEGFEKEMEKQREKARAAHRFTRPQGESAGIDPGRDISETSFVGYDKFKFRAPVVRLMVDNRFVDTVGEGSEASVVLESTPFYGEMGGQVGDTGEIAGPSGRFYVTDTSRSAQDVIVHHGYVSDGVLENGDVVEAVVDEQRRLDIARNHTSTHLLHLALREVLGEHVHQRGSLVTPERLRFDFSHLEAMTRDEIGRAGHIVNERIRQNLRVYSEELPYNEAIREGATALFDEKYGDVVRVVKIGDMVVSAELCGGTHIDYTGAIGFFQITGESSVGSGLRRIEAVTGRSAEEYTNRRLFLMERIADYLGTGVSEIENRVAGLSAEVEQERRRSANLERELTRQVALSLRSQIETINGVNVLAAKVPSYRLEALRELSDRLREDIKSVIIVLGTIHNDKPLFLAAVTPDLVARGYHAGEIVKQVARVAGGGGGGKPQFAQAGGKDKGKLDQAIQMVNNLV